MRVITAFLGVLLLVGGSGCGANQKSLPKSRYQNDEKFKQVGSHRDLSPIEVLRAKYSSLVLVCKATPDTNSKLKVMEASWDILAENELPNENLPESKKVIVLKDSNANAQFEAVINVEAVSIIREYSRTDSNQQTAAIKDVPVLDLSGDLAMKLERKSGAVQDADKFVETIADDGVTGTVELGKLSATDKESRAKLLEATLTCGIQSVLNP